MATLPSSLEEDRDDDDNESIETGDLLARLVVDELLSEEDTEPLEEQADRSAVYRMQSRKPILPPSRAVLFLLPLTLIETLDYASNVLNMHRTDIIEYAIGGGAQNST